jgi:hypothetical protein
MTNLLTPGVKDDIRRCALAVADEWGEVALSGDYGITAAASRVLAWLDAQGQPEPPGIEPPQDLTQICDACLVDMDDSEYVW